MHYPTKVKSLSLERHSFTGRLTGIKGQYLLFEDGTVLIFVVQRDVVKISV
jgi:hypothetical protein